MYLSKCTDSMCWCIKTKTVPLEKTIHFTYTSSALIFDLIEWKLLLSVVIIKMMAYILILQMAAKPLEKQVSVLFREGSRIQPKYSLDRIHLKCNCASCTLYILNVRVNLYICLSIYLYACLCPSVSY